MGFILNAQTDEFFSYQYERRENNDNEWSELVMLPNTHGLNYNYPADNVPIGTGLWLLAGLGWAYVSRKKGK